MTESQNIEYKESWRDEYLKWVCGFANAQGGTIYIGIDDTGNIVGVQNVKKLLEDIPNKIQSGLGIQKICDECQGIGAELPVYELVGTTLRIHFKALESALIDQPKVPKGQNEPLGEPKENLLIDKIILLLRDNPKATYNDLVTELSVSRSTIKRAIGNLAADGHVVRVGGKRYGHWEIND